MEPRWKLPETQVKTTWNLVKSTWNPVEEPNEEYLENGETSWNLKNLETQVANGLWLRVLTCIDSLYSSVIAWQYPLLDQTLRQLCYCLTIYPLLHHTNRQLCYCLTKPAAWPNAQTALVLLDNTHCLIKRSDSSGNGPMSKVEALRQLLTK